MSLVKVKLFLTGRVRERVVHVTHTQTNNLDEIINYLSGKESITKFPLSGTNNFIYSTHKNLYSHFLFRKSDSQLHNMRSISAALTG